MPKWSLTTGRGATHFEEKRHRNAVAAVAETLWYTEPGWSGSLCATSRVSYYLSVTQAGTGGQITLRLKWTDNSGVQQQLDSAPVQTNVLGDATAGDFVVHSAYGSDVFYEIIVTGSPFSYLYDCFMHAEHM